MQPLKRPWDSQRTLMSVYWAEQIIRNTGKFQSTLKSWELERARLTLSKEALVSAVCVHGDARDGLALKMWEKTKSWVASLKARWSQLLLPTKIWKSVKFARWLIWIWTILDTICLLGEVTQIWKGVWWLIESRLKAKHFLSWGWMGIVKEKSFKSITLRKKCKE